MKSKIMYLVCVAYFLSGLNLLSNNIPRSVLKKADPSITAHLTLASVHQVGWFFMIVTPICFALTLLKKVHWAYGIMTFVLFFWALLYLLSWAETGYWRSIYGAANYFLVVGILVLCSRIVEMPKPLQTNSITSYLKDKAKGESK